MQNERMTPQQYAKFLAFKETQLDTPPPKDWWELVKKGRNEFYHIPIGTLLPVFEQLFPDWEYNVKEVATNFLMAKKSGGSFETISSKITLEIVAPLWIKNQKTGEYEYITTMRRTGSALILRKEESSKDEKSAQTAITMAIKHAISMFGARFGRYGLLTETGREITKIEAETVGNAISKKVEAKLNTKI